MGTGYTRNDTSNNIADGNVVNAADLDGEFDAIVAAFNESTGHTHDGTSAEGAPVTVLGPAQEWIADGTALYPKTDDTYDLGKSGAEIKDIYVDGVAYLDSATITAGTITGITDLAVADGGTGASTASGARTNLGVAIGSDVQAWDADLDAIAALAKTDGNFVVGNGSTWVAESGATARASLGLGSIATQAATSVNIDGGSIDGVTIGASSAGAGTFSSLTVGGTGTNQPLTVTSTDAFCTIGLEDDSTTGTGYVAIQAQGDALQLKSGNAISVQCESAEISFRIGGNERMELTDDLLHLNGPRYLRISDASGPGIQLYDLGATAGIEGTRLLNAADAFAIQTTTTGDVKVSDDYKIDRGASGATIHRMYVGASEEMRVASGLFRAKGAYDNQTATAANVVITDTIGTFAFSTSMGEYKVNREDIVNSGWIVDSISPFKYDSTHKVDEGKRFVGFEYEEVAGVLPEADVNGTNYDTRALLAVLWQEVKELRVRVAELEAKS